MLTTNREILETLLVQLKSICESAPYRAPEQYQDTISQLLDIYTGAQINADALQSQDIDINAQGWVCFYDDAVCVQDRNKTVVLAVPYDKAWDVVRQTLDVNEATGGPVEETTQRDVVACCQEGVLLAHAGRRFFLSWEAIREPSTAEVLQ